MEADTFVWVIWQADFASPEVCILCGFCGFLCGWGVACKRTLGSLWFQDNKSDQDQPVHVFARGHHCCVTFAFDFSSWTLTFCVRTGVRYLFSIPNYSNKRQLVPESSFMAASSQWKDWKQISSTWALTVVLVLEEIVLLWQRRS